MKLYFMHRPSSDHLEKVRKEMQEKGSPTIRVVDCEDYYIAIEGMHRLRAACELGIQVDLEILEQGDMIDFDSLDLEFGDFSRGEKYTAGEVAGECYHEGAGCYDINDEGLLTLDWEAEK